MALKSILSVFAIWAATTAQAETFHIKDNQGFGRSLTAMTVDLPPGWTATGEVLWLKPCSGSDHYEMVFSARSADGRTGLRFLPGHQVLWLESVPNGLPPDLAQISIAQVEASRNEMATQFRDSNCHVARITSGDQLVRALLLSKRPEDTRVISDKPWDASIANYRALFGAAASSGMKVLFDSRDITLGYTGPAGPVEESILFSWYMFQLDPPSWGPGTFSQHTIVETIRVAWVAPERRAADKAAIAAILKSFKVDPEWQKEINAYFEKIRKQRQQDAAERDQRRQQDEARRDQQHQQFLQMIQQ